MVQIVNQMVLVSFGAHADIWAYVLVQLGWNDLWKLRRLLFIDWCWEILAMALFFIFDFYATFGGKMGVAATRAPSGLGPPNLTKKLAHWVELLDYHIKQLILIPNFKWTSMWRSGHESPHLIAYQSENPSPPSSS